MCKTRSVGELMEIIFKRFQENGGVIDVGDFVYVPTQHGTVVYPRAEYDKLIADANNNPNKQLPN